MLGRWLQNSPGLASIAPRLTAEFSLVIRIRSADP